MISAVIDVFILQNDIAGMGEPPGGKRWNYTGNLWEQHIENKKTWLEI
jgi:hypothetical protein